VDSFPLHCGRRLYMALLGCNHFQQYVRSWWKLT
jgi:hypothetical protein